MDRIASELSIEVIDLSQKDISFFDYEHKNRNDEFELTMNYVLEHENIIFASPEYWYAVSSPMKIFLDRISDYLEIPELLEKGRLLRGKTAYVVCTSIYEKPSSPYLDCFKMTFDYLGMHFCGYIHANCKNGYKAEENESEINIFIDKLRD